MGTETYEGICEKLDDVSLKLFDLLDKLMEEREKLNELIKFGFVDMAKARYSIGNHRISSLQLDMKEMSALKLVANDECSCKGYSFNSFVIVDTLNTVKEDSVKTEDGVRKRITQSIGNDDINQLNTKIESVDLNSADCESSTSSENILMETRKHYQKINDPLKWFGILTPQSLRNCQKHFQRSLDNVATIASVQNEIKALFNYMDYLKAEKKKMQEQKH